MQPSDKVMIDVAAVGTTLGSLGEILPPIASIFTIIWMGIRIYETDTIKNVIGKETDNEHGSDPNNTD
jgi:hypothetical protein